MPTAEDRRRDLAALGVTDRDLADGAVLRPARGRASRSPAPMHRAGTPRRLGPMDVCSDEAARAAQDGASGVYKRARQRTESLRSHGELALGLAPAFWSAPGKAWERRKCSNREPGSGLPRQRQVAPAEARTCYVLQFRLGLTPSNLSCLQFANRSGVDARRREMPGLGGSNAEESRQDHR